MLAKNILDKMENKDIRLKVNAFNCLISNRYSTSESIFRPQVMLMSNKMLIK